LAFRRFKRADRPRLKRRHSPLEESDRKRLLRRKVLVDRPYRHPGDTRRLCSSSAASLSAEKGWTRDSMTSRGGGVGIAWLLPGVPESAPRRAATAVSGSAGRLNSERLPITRPAEHPGDVLAHPIEIIPGSRLSPSLALHTFVRGRPIVGAPSFLVGGRLHYPGIIIR
jgi:hypothetical protein